MNHTNESPPQREDLVFTERIIARVMPLYRRYLWQRLRARLGNMWPQLFLLPLASLYFLYLAERSSGWLRTALLTVPSVALAVPALVLLLEALFAYSSHRSVARDMAGLGARIRQARSGEYRLPLARTRAGLVFGTGTGAVRRELAASKYMIEDGEDLWLIAFDDERVVVVPTSGLSSEMREFIRNNVVYELAGHYPLSGHWRR